MRLFKYFFIILLLIISYSSFSNTTKDDSIISILHSNNSNADQLNAQNLESVGDYYYKSGIKDSALYFYKIAIEKTKTSKEDKISKLKVKLGNAYMDIGEFEKALTLYNESKEYFVEIKDSFEVINITNRIGILYEHLDNFTQSQKLYNEALRYYERRNDSLKQAIILSNLGNTYYQLGDNELSLEFMNKAKKIYILQDQKIQELKINISISNVLMNIDSLEKAEELLLISLNGFEQENILEGKAMIFHNLGIIYKKKDNYQKAIDFFQRSIEIKEKINLRTSLLNSYSSISDAYYYIDQHKKAYQFQIKYVNLKDSLLNEELIQKISDIQMNYELTIRENQIKVLEQEVELNQIKIEKDQNTRNLLFGILGLSGVILLIVIVFIYLIRKRNEILKDNNQQLEDLNKILEKNNNTKSKLFSIISHDLKNPIIGMERLSLMLSQGLEKLPEEKIKYFTEEIHQSTKDVNYLLTNILNWSQSQIEGIEIHPTFVNINTLTKNIIAQHRLEASRKNIEFDFEDKETAVFADEDMIKIVLRNLISNAIKFSDNNSTIKIEVLEKSSLVEYKICDQGIGISEEDIKNLFIPDFNVKKIGKSKEKGTGLGLILCKEFLLLNKGKIWVESKLGEGTTFYLSLPKNKEL